MKQGLFLLAAMCVVSPLALNQDLSGVKNVYLLPMGGGFEQYLANQLTMQGVYQVVTDPAKADAIFTDQIGAKLERQLEELYPPPELEPPEEETEKNAEEDSAAESGSSMQFKKSEEPVPISSFARGKGNIFLVGRESRLVIWSIYLRPKSHSSKEMDKAASKVVEELRTDILGQ